jgi:hypothetical protein
VRHRGVVDGEESPRVDVVCPHGVRIGVEEQAEPALALDQRLAGALLGGDGLVEVGHQTEGTIAATQRSLEPADQHQGAQQSGGEHQPGEVGNEGADQRSAGRDDDQQVSRGDLHRAGWGVEDRGAVLVERRPDDDGGARPANGQVGDVGEEQRARLLGAVEVEAEFDALEDVSRRRWGERHRFGEGELSVDGHTGGRVGGAQADADDAVGATAHEADDLEALGTEGTL